MISIFCSSWQPKQMLLHAHPSHFSFHRSSSLHLIVSFASFLSFSSFSPPSSISGLFNPPTGRCFHCPKSLSYICMACSFCWGGGPPHLVFNHTYVCSTQFQMDMWLIKLGFFVVLFCFLHDYSTQKKRKKRKQRMTTSYMFVSSRNPSRLYRGQKQG